uniref:Uncharacterized protein n=1 Tax=Fibrocapsa japonica TaxID=94617 RepID=A0A6U1PBJ4_9STRA|mmetsp:Transcript_3491/g.5166  ORF Transcript_3491/g.5166 Transcript_3491/m.5166 type:complete len:129 (+) Transcript_3491:80-466(+)
MDLHPENHEISGTEVPGGPELPALGTPQVQCLVPALMAALALHSVGAVFEGILLGKLDQIFMAKSYLVTSVIVSLYEVLYAQRRGGRLELVWGGMIVYNISRIVQFSARLWWKGRSGKREEKAQLKLA